MLTGHALATAPLPMCPDRHYLHIQVLQTAKDKLNEVNGGGFDLNTWWRQGLTDEDSFDRAAEVAQNTLMQCHGKAIVTRGEALKEVVLWCVQGVTSDALQMSRTTSRFPQERSPDETVVALGP